MTVKITQTEPDQALADTKVTKVWLCHSVIQPGLSGYSIMIFCLIDWNWSLPLRFYGFGVFLIVLKERVKAPAWSRLLELQKPLLSALTPNGYAVVPLVWIFLKIPLSLVCFSFFVLGSGFLVTKFGLHPHCAPKHAFKSHCSIFHLPLSRIWMVDLG